MDKSDTQLPSATAPDGKPIYRFLTGPEDKSFCERVSAELANGWVLYGNPTMTFNGERVIVGQVIIWPED